MKPVSVPVLVSLMVLVLVILLVVLLVPRNKDVTSWPLDANSHWINFDTQISGSPWHYTWQPFPGAKSYLVELLDSNGNLTGQLRLSNGSTTLGPSARVAGDVTEIFSNGYENSIRITAHTSNGNVTNQLNGPCFLAGSLVQMEDGVKVIEDVQIGDRVVGAFGEINIVLALHRPLLGTHNLIKINSNHITTEHHPHVSVDKKFYCGKPAVVSETTYGRFHEVITEKGKEEMFLHGLKPERIQQLVLGVELKTFGGSTKVESIEKVEMPPSTQLYNLVVSKSHTYHVDGYAVTGWPREDFNYDTWEEFK